MRLRFRALSLTTVALAALSACSGSDAVAPRVIQSSAASRDRSGPPGSVAAPKVATQGGLHGCVPRDPQVGTAVIGPSGGELVVGPHRLIIPPGALTTTVTITGTAPEADVPTIELEPHGLQFKKSAGLILDASNCTDVPPIVYINELGIASDPILAVYSTWWHTIAAPIDHFSGYAVAF